jgi:hypothetical protein
MFEGLAEEVYPVFGESNILQFRVSRNPTFQG